MKKQFCAVSIDQLFKTIVEAPPGVKKRKLKTVAKNYIKGQFKIEKIMKTTLLIIAMAATTSFSQNIIAYVPDTIEVNSGYDQSISIPFVNNTTDYVQIGVMETSIDPLTGITDSIGFFSVASPLPGEPETITAEPWDSLRAFYQIDPGLNQGYHTVQICFWNEYTQSDTTCSQMVVYLHQTVGMLNDNELNITVYPNPTSDYLNIDTHHDVLSVEIKSICGSLIYSGNEQQINVQNLDPGSYYVFITLDDKRQVMRQFIKK